MARYFRRLGAFVRLVRYDARGVGLSDPIDLTRTRSLTDMVNDAVAVLDAVDAGQVAIIAENGGVPVAIEFAATHPDRVSALVCINGFACLIADDDSPGGFPKDLVEAFPHGEHRSRRALGGAGRYDVALIVPSLQHDPSFREWWARASRRGAPVPRPRVC